MSLLVRLRKVLAMQRRINAARGYCISSNDPAAILELKEAICETLRELLPSESRQLVTPLIAFVEKNLCATKVVSDVADIVKQSVAVALIVGIAKQLGSDAHSGWLDIRNACDQLCRHGLYQWRPDSDDKFITKLEVQLKAQLQGTVPDGWDGIAPAWESFLRRTKISLPIRNCMHRFSWGR